MAIDRNIRVILTQPRHADRRRSAGWTALETIVATVILSSLLATLTVTVSQARRASSTMADRRAAARLVEQVFAVHQSTPLTPGRVDPATLLGEHERPGQAGEPGVVGGIEADRADDVQAPSGYGWARVRAQVGRVTVEMVGLVLTAEQGAEPADPSPMDRSADHREQHP